jgi:RNA polymerase sigma-70 factor (ECF subfamily)
MSSDVPDPELLLAHASFVRALARRLAADESTADDLVQDTWTAALQTPPAHARSLRGWLAGIVSNLWRERARSELRRRTREEAAAREETTPDPSDAIDAVATGRELVDLVLALDEPFRTTLVLRYYENLPPRAIARRMDVPVKTVNSRLSRGLARVRDSWIRGRASDARAARAAWLVLARASASSPVAAGASTSSAFSIGALYMSAKLALWCAVLVSGGALVYLWQHHPPVRPPTTVGDASPLAHEMKGGSELTAIVAFEGRASDRRADAGARPVDLAIAGSSAVAPSRRIIRGRVVDCDAAPLAGVEVGFRRRLDAPAEARAMSSGRGVFELDAPRDQGFVLAEDPSLATLYFGSVDESAHVEPLIVVAHACELGGRVVDEHGLPLGRARVRLVPPRDFASRFDAVPDATQHRDWSALTDEQGRFALAGAPMVEHAEIAASLDGFDEGRVAEPLGADRNIEIVLAHRGAVRESIAGRVVDPGGKSVARARVTLGARVALSDESGEFRLSTEGAARSLELVALSRGFLPGRARASADAATGAPVWPDFVIIALGGAPLSISGRVVDEHGKPRGGVLIWVQNPRSFGVLRDDTEAKIEYLLASTAAMESDDELSDANWHSQSTAADGRFRIDGLLDREYTLRVLDPKTLGACLAGPFDAGRESVEVVFRDGELHRIAGRVVTRAGQPVEGAHVQVLGEAFGGVWNESGHVTTGADGRFAFEAVGTNTLSVWARGEEIVSVMYAISDAAHATDLEVAVSVRCHFKVDCSATPELADAIRALDGDGEVMTLREVGPGGEFSSNTFTLASGRSTTLGVASDVRTLVLLKGGVEVKRVPLDLAPGRVNVVQP